jgi:hypothetical protein
MEYSSMKSSFQIGEIDEKMKKLDVKNLQEGAHNRQLLFQRIRLIQVG